MTTVARSYRTPEPARAIDVRCSAALPQLTPDTGRCQLFAGHDGPHAVMFAHCGKRSVRLWKTALAATTADAGPETMQRPWMFGFPLPAWFETD
jgi:hypothetical protein